VEILITTRVRQAVDIGSVLFKLAYTGKWYCN